MSDTIFKSTAEMPPENNAEVVRTALTKSQLVTDNYMPSSMPMKRDVQSVERPRRGHGY
jgi:hypothetical protein